MPENGANGERRAVTGLALKWIHVVGFLVLNIATVAGMWATMRAQVDELREQQSQTISEKEFQEFKEDVRHRLERMEQTLDRLVLKKSIAQLE